jgi:hypothetical protein
MKLSRALAICALGFAATAMTGVRSVQDNDAEHCGASDGGADPQELQPRTSGAATQQGEKALYDKGGFCTEWVANGECTENPAYMLDMCALSCKGPADRQKLRLLVVRTNRCASTAIGGWILRAVHASHGRLEAYRADDGEVALTGVTAWAAHANAVLQHRTIGPLPEYNGIINPKPQKIDLTLIVAFIRSPLSQFPSAYGSFKSSQMGNYGKSVSDTLRRPPQPENWRLDNMNARSLGWGPLKSGAWDKKLTAAQERHVAGLAPQAFVAQVEREVDLVLIADLMVESLVVLRRALGFSASALHGDLAMLKGINAHLPEVSGLDTSMSPDDMKRICSDTWSSVDCALFEHFNASLWAKIEAGGEEFAEEVRDVRHHWSTLDKCCENNSCDLIEQIETCDHIRNSVRTASPSPIIVQF